MFSLLGASQGQQVGSYAVEQHPNLTTYRCTIASGCEPAATAVVLDANWRCELQ